MEKSAADWGKLFGAGAKALGLGGAVAGGTAAAYHNLKPETGTPTSNFHALNSQLNTRLQGSPEMGEATSALQSGDWEKYQKLQQGIAGGNFGDNGNWLYRNTLGLARNNVVGRNLGLSDDSTSELMRQRDSIKTQLQKQTGELAQKGVMTPQLAQSRIAQLQQQMTGGQMGSTPAMQEALQAQIKSLQARATMPVSMSPEFENHRQNLLNSGIDANTIQQWAGLGAPAAAQAAGPVQIPRELLQHIAQRYGPAYAEQFLRSHQGG